MLLPKFIIHGFTECLIHHHGFLHNLASDQVMHFMAKKYSNGLKFMKFTGLTPCRNS